MAYNEIILKNKLCYALSSYSKFSKYYNVTLCRIVAYWVPLNERRDVYVSIVTLACSRDCFSFKLL